MKKFFILTYICFYLKSHDGVRIKKSIIFPPTSPTRTQLIYGIGIPLEDLDLESFTTGYVLKAEYFLPTRAMEFRKTQLTPLAIGFNPNRKRDVSVNTRNDENTSNTQIIQRQSYRWAVYKRLSIILERFDNSRSGLNGDTCLLRTICEIGSIPFHPKSGLLAELIHILLSPSMSCDVMKKHENNQYIKAEVLGKESEPCNIIFKECNISNAQQFTLIKDYFT